MTGLSGLGYQNRSATNLNNLSGVNNTNRINNLNIPGYTQLGNRSNLPKSNYVTSDNYVPSYLTSNYSALNLDMNPTYNSNPDFLQGIASGIKSNLLNKNSPQQFNSNTNNNNYNPSN